MEDIEILKKRLNCISHELSEIRKLAFCMDPNKKDSEKAWDDLMNASEEISDLWTDISTVEEIRSQREKSW